MEATTDPDVWIKNLEFLQRSLEPMGYTMNDMDFMIDILQNVPNEYENVLELLEYELDKELMDRHKSKSSYEQKKKESIKKKQKIPR